jgi:diguanylate cyclase (GGDEF)-like protein
VVHDPLTGLANRVLFSEVLGREIGRAAGRGGGLSLLMLDLDFFKKVNDGYGHPVGDLVLRQFAQILRKELRRADLPARVGGEEFAVVLTQEKDQAVLVAEKIRKAVSQEAFGEQGDAFRLTVSIGCAAWKAGQSPEALVKAADEALYRAKGGGRDKVVAA